MKTKSLVSKLIAGMLVIAIIGAAAFSLTSCGGSDEYDDASSYSDIKWPDSKLASMLPTPKSTYGEITLDSSDSLSVDIAKTESADFKEYVKQCKSKGFTVDYTNMDGYYSADNKDGYSLTLSYDEDEKVMDIDLDAPDKDSDDKEETKSTAKKSKSKTSSKASSSKASSSGVSSKFKKTMDDYEAFIDKYVAFMKKYKNSDDIAGKLTEYTDMMSKYNSYEKKIEDIDTDSLSSDDYAYYIEVTGRVAKKLASVA